MWNVPILYHRAATDVLTTGATPTARPSALGPARPGAGASRGRQLLGQWALGRRDGEATAATATEY